MSEEPKESGKKKGGKMPIIIALAVVLGGGGFFMTKKKAPELPKIEAAEEAVSCGEMTMNLKESGNYVKTEIILLPRKDYPKEKLEKSLDLVRDFLNAKIPDYSLTNFQTYEGKQKVKHELCEGINKVLPTVPEMTNPAGAKKKKKKSAEEDAPDEESNWDSAEGPVLKVMFKSFAWQ